MIRTGDRVGSPSAWTFREFSRSDKQPLIGLLGIGRPAGYADVKQRIFDWQFSRNPHDDGRAPFLVGEAAGSVVAANGFMPVRIRFQGQRVLACWSCDTFVAPACRGQGLGKQLVKHVSEAAPVMLGYGISNMSDPIFARFAWAPHPSVKLLFFHVAETGLFGTAKNLCSRLTGLRAFGRRHRTCHVVADVDRQASSELDELWQRVAKGYPSAIERDAAYLCWKYAEHPTHQYVWYALRCRHHLEGVMIARHHARESVIVDYCGPANDVDVMTELASHVVDDLVRRRTIRIRCETTHRPMIGALRRVGFVRSRYTARFRVRANIDANDPLAGWFLMTGDSDGDMLSLPPLERDVVS